MTAKSTAKPAPAVAAGTSWAFTEHRTLAEVDHAVVALPIAEVHPDPDQPRKVFDEHQLAMLTASIREEGLLQPIEVTKDPAGGYKIVFGERRWRAHLRNQAKTILARVVERAPADVLVAQVIENTQRADMTPLEEAHAYQRAVDLLGAEEGARRLGFVQLSAITNRTSLLRLLPEYQQLLAGRQLKTSEAYEMSQLSPVGQKKLFTEIRLGRCPTLAALRAVATAIGERERQASIFDLVDAPPEPTAEDRKAVSRLARKIRQVEVILAMGFDDNEIVAVKKIDPNKAATYADKLVLIQKHLGQMERALRAAAVTNDLFAA